MKKPILILVCILIICTCLVAQAQEKAKSAFFAKTILITKIYSHSLGYKIVYHKIGLELGAIYLPFSWFSQVNSPGKLVTGVDRSYPYFTAFYRDGKFDHIMVFVQESRDDMSWSKLNIPADEATKLFTVDINNFNIEY
jgi:hypothetical protein